MAIKAAVNDPRIKDILQGGGGGEKSVSILISKWGELAGYEQKMVAQRAHLSDQIGKLTQQIEQTIGGRAAIEATLLELVPAASPVVVAPEERGDDGDRPPQAPDPD